jgi:uncharacterized protein (DUF1499 family)
LPDMRIRLLSFILPALLAACGSAPPENLGLGSEGLAPCPETPNCVSSFAPKSDAVHYVAPFRYQDTREDARRRLIALLKNPPGKESVTVVEENEQYIRAEFRTSFFRFTDDVEFNFPPDAEIIHVRSASRVGRSDLGTNRRRIEELRALFEES